MGKGWKECWEEAEDGVGYVIAMGCVDDCVCHHKEEKTLCNNSV